MRELIENWDGESVVISYHAPTDTWIFIAIHSTVLGPANGGCRMRVYDDPEDGLRDAMRLAEGMTHKWAGIGFDIGGGKGVLAVPGPLDLDARRQVLHHFGRLLRSLNGAYCTGEDLGTTPEDMATIAEEAPEFVHGVGVRAAALVDPGPYTAFGVFLGIRACVHHVFGSPELQGRSVLVQGVGDVGAPLARRLRDSGARLLVCDTDVALAGRIAQELDGDVVGPEAVYHQECDVYAPCAMGATLSRHTIPKLRCCIVAGSANNQLAEPEDAERLYEREILYAPDYIVNAGGAVALPLLGKGHSEEEVWSRVRRIEGTVEGILREAKEQDESPVHAARRIVDRALANKRREPVTARP